jgi:3-dehydroquinate synthase
VLADTDVLDTLSPREFAAGYAEVAKYGLIDKPEFFAWLEKNWRDIFAGGDARIEAIATSCQAKADVVAADEREASHTAPEGKVGRAILNYGHTLAHAIEKVEGYTWSHGNAVAVGMVYAATLSAGTGRPDFTAQTREVLQGLGLPTGYRGDWAALRAAMAIDKKSRGGPLRFVLLDDLAQPVTVPIDDEDLLLRAYEDLCA